ncbi:hypothetical protein ElyMa_006107300 [Elysia marginata]|uniref:Uncharacterized protein n=1 Tax=Elysia marginata TaxID=1093978 RepID=A0AAV4GS80_9GAST|nr:hypothetical protein ElyMa_006107300 [Elysia marginata]
MTLSVSCLVSNYPDLVYMRGPGRCYINRNTNMLKMVLAVFLSLAVMAVYTEAISSYDNKQLNDEGHWEMEDGIEMDNGAEMSINKRVPRACTRSCNCLVMSRRACNYCLYLRHLCIREYGTVVDA